MNSYELQFEIWTKTLGMLTIILAMNYSIDYCED